VNNSRTCMLINLSKLLPLWSSKFRHILNTTEWSVLPFCFKEQSWTDCCSYDNCAPAGIWTNFWSWKRLNFYHVMLQTLLGKTFHIWLEILMMLLSGCIYVHVQDMLSLSLYQAIASLCCKKNGMKGGGSSTTTSTNIELGLFQIGKVLKTLFNWRDCVSLCTILKFNKSVELFLC
jgi:hypothetical protein